MLEQSIIAEEGLSAITDIKKQSWTGYQVNAQWQTKNIYLVLTWMDLSVKSIHVCKKTKPHASQKAHLPPLPQPVLLCPKGQFPSWSQMWQLTWLSRRARPSFLSGISECSKYQMEHQHIPVKTAQPQLQSTSQNVWWKKGHEASSIHEVEKYFWAPPGNQQKPWSIGSPGTYFFQPHQTWPGAALMNRSEKNP